MITYNVRLKNTEVELSREELMQLKEEVDSILKLCDDLPGGYAGSWSIDNEGLAEELYQGFNKTNLEGE